MDENLEKTVDDIIEQIGILGDRPSERVEQIESGSDLEEERAQEAYEEIRETSDGKLANGYGGSKTQYTVSEGIAN